MKVFGFTAAVALLAGAAAPAMAATLFSSPGGPYDQMLHNDRAPDGTTVTLVSKDAGDLVDLISPSILSPNGNGFAQVNGSFLELTIDPQDPLLGFSKIGFTLNPVKKSGNDQLFDYAFKVDLTFVGGGVQTLSSASFPSFQKFDIWQEATDPGAIASVRIYGLTGYVTEKQDQLVCTIKNGREDCKSKKVDVTIQKTGLAFDDIRHISYDGAYAAVSAPEPGTWALMILGFGGAGAMLRRRRAVAA